MHKVLNILIFCFILFSGTAQNYLYVDSLYEYKVQVPKWLTINENVENHVFGGIFHSTDHTENSIYIHGFEKKNIKRLMILSLLLSREMCPEKKVYLI